MKYKHRLEKLAIRQKAWDSLKSDEQHATTRPGSKKK